MRNFVTTTVAIALIVWLSKCADAECLNSAQAVWAEQPRAHATWSYVDGVRCWRAGWPRTSPRHRHRAVGMAPEITPGTSALPLPRPRPDLEILFRQHYPRLTQDQGRALADELLGAR